MRRMLKIMLGKSSDNIVLEPYWPKNLIRKLKINSIYAEARKI